MKETGNFYTPEEVKQLYEQIIPIYQSAFAGEPWFEVSKCEDSEVIKRCLGGFSSLSTGELCQLCMNRLTRPAYEQAELVEVFDKLAKTRPTAWYLEGFGQELILAAVTWSANVETIADEKYQGDSKIKTWMREKLGTEPIIWLDDIFADKRKRPDGNLKNFRSICMGFALRLQGNTVAYRTINERMLRAPIRDFGNNCKIFRGNIDVPDRRHFVVINLGGQK